MKRQLQTAIEERFFPQRRDYSSNLVAFSDRVSQMVRTEDVAHLIADVLSRTLNLSDVCVVLWESPEQSTIAARLCNDPEAPQVETQTLISLRRHLRREHSLLALETLDDEHVLVIVTDVSGKGLPASFYIAELHGMVCIASTTCATPSQMLATINDHLYREMPRGTFITATALLFDTERRRLSLARAGHTPLIYRNHSETVALTPPGPALGFVRGHRFLSMLSEERIDYLPGDTFILYSDGISEMMNGGREEFGDERLRDLVENLEEPDAEAIRDRIVLTVDGFRNGAEQHDDMTVVVVQAEGEGGHHPTEPVEQVASA